MVRRTARRARGVALLIVLVVLVLLATLATEIAVSAKTGYRLADHSMDDLLLTSAVDGRLVLLQKAIEFEQSKNKGYDGEADEWSWHNHEKLSSWKDSGSTSFGSVTGDEAELTAQFRNTDVELLAWVEDERAKLNLRGLLKPDGDPTFVHTRAALVRLIDLYRERISSLDLSEGDAQDMVDDLVTWLRAEADTDNNPMPAVKDDKTRGRLQTPDDLLRVPGGHWTAERLYDVKDPETVDDEEGVPVTSDDSSSDDTGADAAWERPNGIPGLIRYVTVFAEPVADPAMRINVNTAPELLIKALLEPGDEELAKKIVEHRRTGADDEGTDTGTASGAGSTAQGFFKNKSDLTKVDGMDQDLAKYPRLNFFADVGSAIYSLRVIATTVRKDASAADGDDEAAPKEIKAIHDARVVVQRLDGGMATLFAERRNDPLFER